MSIVLYIENNGKWLAAVDNQATAQDVGFPIRKWILSADSKKLDIYIGDTVENVLGIEPPKTLDAELGLLKTNSKERAIHELLPKLGENINLFMYGCSEYSTFINVFLGYDFKKLFEKEGIHAFTAILNRFYKLKRPEIGYGFTVFTNTDYENFEENSIPKKIFAYPLEYGTSTETPQQS